MSNALIHRPPVPNPLRCLWPPLFFTLILLSGPASIHAATFTEAHGRLMDDEDAINLYCLRASYPGAFTVKKSPAGDYELLFPDSSIIPYGDVRDSLAQPYLLEPLRPDTPEGYAPGRQRAYRLLGSMYGKTREQVGRRLATVSFLGKKLSMAPEAAAAFKKAGDELMRLAPGYRAWLLPEGAFHWRQIDGENRLSAHSYGIAVDMGVKKAPYWRWSKARPHPLQKSYPAEIVGIMERHGFIWGGKWHEYDLMHYEYRPEIICKARIRRAMMAGKK